MPIMDIFFMTISCVPQNGVYMHSIYTTLLCWSNMHIVHGIVAIFAIILYYSICIFISLTYFECRYIMNDASAKVSGRPLALFFTYELVMIICYAFMDD